MVSVADGSVRLGRRSRRRRGAGGARRLRPREVALGLARGGGPGAPPIGPFGCPAAWRWTRAGRRQRGGRRRGAERAVGARAGAELSRHSDEALTVDPGAFGQARLRGERLELALRVSLAQRVDLTAQRPRHLGRHIDAQSQKASAELVLSYRLWRDAARTADEERSLAAVVSMGADYDNLTVIRLLFGTTDAFFAIQSTLAVRVTFAPPPPRRADQARSGRNAPRTRSRRRGDRSRPVRDTEGRCTSRKERRRCAEHGSWWRWRCWGSRRRRGLPSPVKRERRTKGDESGALGSTSTPTSTVGADGGSLCVDTWAGYGTSFFSAVVGGPPRHLRQPGRRPGEPGLHPLGHRLRHHAARWRLSAADQARVLTYLNLRRTLATCN